MQSIGDGNWLLYHKTVVNKQNMLIKQADERINLLKHTYLIHLSLTSFNVHFHLVLKKRRVLTLKWRSWIIKIWPLKEGSVHRHICYPKRIPLLPIQFHPSIQRCPLHTSSSTHHWLLHTARQQPTIAHPSPKSWFRIIYKNKSMRMEIRKSQWILILLTE